MSSSSAPSRVFTSRDLAQLLSAALGSAQATDVIAAALRALGVSNPEAMELGTAKRVLTYVSNVDGLVGITGRVALTRLQYGASTSGSVPAASVRKETRPLALVVGLLAADIGEERAQKLVEETAAVMSLPGQLEIDQALALLEKITRMSGSVGVAARFAKTRIHLKW